MYETQLTRFNCDFGSLTQLDAFLKERSFACNPDPEKLSFTPFPITQVHERDYLFHYKGFDYEIGQLSRNEPDMDEHQLFYVKALRSYQMIASLHLNQAVIPPFFTQIAYYPEFNVYVGALRAEAPDSAHPFHLDLYYFDGHGRYLKQEQGYMPNGVVNVAVIGNQIIDIRLPPGRSVMKLYRYNLMELYHSPGRTELTDHLGKRITERSTKRIIVSPDRKDIIIQGHNAVYHVDPDARKTTRLPYKSLFGYNSHYIRVTVRQENGRNKCGVIDYQGREIIPPIYDSVTLQSVTDRFKVFHGDYTWHRKKITQEDILDENDEWLPFNDEYADIIAQLEEHGEESVWIDGKLGAGKWGIIDLHHNAVVPATYDWIEEYDEAHYIANLGGSLYKYSAEKWYAAENYDKQRDHPNLIAVIGGDWFLLDRSGHVERPYELDENDMLFLTDERSMDFFRRRDNSVLKLKGA